MDFIKAMVLSALGMWAIEATAQTTGGEWAFVDRPAVFTDAYPNRVECAQKTLSYVTCIPPNLPGRIRTLAEDLGTGHRFVTDIWSTVLAVCDEGYCDSYDNGQYLGRGPVVSQGSYQVKLPVGYYLAIEGQYVVAWKYGHGPDRQNFMEFRFLSEERTTYPVSCWPSEPKCSYSDGDQYGSIEPEDLPQYIPMLEDTTGLTCQFELCTDSNGDTVGLNPDYYLWNE